MRIEWNFQLKIVNFQLSIAWGLIFLSHDLHAHGATHFRADPCRLKPSSPIFDSQHHHVIGFLIGHDHKTGLGIKRKMPRPFAAAGRVAARTELAAALFYAEDRDAVVLAVRSVEKLPGRVNSNLGG